MRKVLLAVAAVAFVAILALLAYDLLAGEPDERGAHVEHLEVASELTGATRPLTAVVPAGVDDGERRPLLIFLHGRGGSPDDNLSDELFRALEQLGDRAPVIAYPDGGEGSYWHDRRDGAWGTYLMKEVLPTALRELPADPRRVAIGGISMGGFGALDAARLHPGRFCAVGAHSPALWRTGAETAPGAFDDAEDFAAHDVIATAAADPGAYAAQPLWVDGGQADPFDPGIDAFVAALQANGVPISAHRWPGGHEGDYWRAHVDEYLRFYARSCG
ncbi:MAG TPA: alpha/beta hydrolase-fold protein [Capillimicrobium sp.]|nr:alpha/beta hydrolase-fold protein [Capillimicrobium sp.]